MALPSVTDTPSLNDFEAAMWEGWQLDRDGVADSDFSPRNNNRHHTSLADKSPFVVTPKHSPHQSLLEFLKFSAGIAQPRNLYTCGTSQN